VFGERADRRRVSEVGHFFRCKICGGYLDARDLVWVEDHEGPLPHPAQDQAQLAAGSISAAWLALERGKRILGPAIIAPTHDDAALMILRR
jgi:hypothetical protein